MKQNKTIAIDFDGVIHGYRKGYHDGSIYDTPIKGSIKAIQKLQNRDYNVVILTARKEKKDIADYIAKWADKRNITLKEIPKITNTKIPAFVYIDDRAMRFRGNWTDILNYF